MHGFKMLSPRQQLRASRSYHQWVSKSHQPQPHSATILPAARCFAVWLLASHSFQHVIETCKLEYVTLHVRICVLQHLRSSGALLSYYLVALMACANSTWSHISYTKLTIRCMCDVGRLLCNSFERLKCIMSCCI